MKLMGFFVLLFVLASCGGNSATSLGADPASNSASSSSSNSGANSSSSGAVGPGSRELAEVTLSTRVTMDASNSTRTVGVTFNFDEQVQLGQFVDGSYFVVPAAGKSSLTIESLDAAGGKVQADENPNYLSHGLTDNSKNYGSHVAGEQLAFPFTASGNTTIVVAVQKDEASYGNCGTKAIVGECIDAIFSLTVLDSIPPKKAIRPSLSSKEKRKNDLNA